MTKYEGLMIAGRWLTMSRAALIVVFIVSLLSALYLATPFSLMRGVAVETVSLFAAILALWCRWQAFATDHSQFQNLVNAGGIYSHIRFPVYLSDLLIVFALSLFAGVWSYLLFAVLLSYMVINRMVLWQESVMKNSNEVLFADWAERTTALFPIKGKRVAVTNSNSFLQRLSRLSPSLLFVTASYAAIDLLKGYMVTFVLQFNSITALAFLVALLLFVVLSFVKR